jgi:hypothetical protein
LRNCVCIFERCRVCFYPWPAQHVEVSRNFWDGERLNGWELTVTAGFRLVGCQRLIWPTEIALTNKSWPKVCNLSWSGVSMTAINFRAHILGGKSSQPEQASQPKFTSKNRRSWQK